MTNATEDPIIVLIDKISVPLNRYITLFVILFGTIGNLLNIIVLCQPVFRKNPCALYFLVSSISALGIFVFGLLSRFISEWTSEDPANTNGAYCKIRIYLLYSCRTISVWLLVFATVDRWCSSSLQIRRRHLSSYINACKCIRLICLLSIILWIETLVCYDANVTNAPIKCYGKTNDCRMFNDTMYATSIVAIPSLLMLYFGFLTIRNIRQLHRTIQPFILTFSRVNQVNRTKSKKYRRTEGSLTRMLLLQVILMTLCSMPQAVHQFYLTITINEYKSSYREAIEKLIVNLDFSLTYAGNGISFSIYTLNGTVFRQTLIRIIRLKIRQLKF